MSLDFRALTEADFDAMQDIRVRAFGPMPDSGAERWRAINLDLLAQRRLFGVFDGSELAGCGKARGFEQAWHGRLVPTAGMAGITVLPEFRGRGVGTLLMRGLAERSVARGEPLSALFPATVPVYRHLGWELVGAQSRFALPAAQLRVLGGSVRPVRATPADVDRLVTLCRDGLRRTRSSGPIPWSEQDWQRRLTDPTSFVYCTDDGLVVYEWDGTDLSVDLLWAASEDSMRSLWSLVGSGSSIARTVYAHLSPEDPLFWALPEEAGHAVTQHGWMLRVLDVPGALAARGYPAAVEASVVVRVDDSESAANSRTWRLEVSGGAGQLQPVDDAPSALALSARGLAGLYAGRPVAALRRAGLAGESESYDEVADAVFATSVAYLTDYF
ncbi:enhanced intracellular survival protein Eis [Nostocoides sp. HKS02]|uniref:GNAT family N-acetyltransferase n=1 Tax=Nostocoides sp. HKS02 TaxID=1813880 RepID=UPI0012B46F68|nr:GNAT family N-acetyltransferase [Tetrasphaera sp. HKS02]QGN56673.1 GNAT family N-acetyltransferase [Tetrasphaera sp. HKS02]